MKRLLLLLLPFLPLIVKAQTDGYFNMSQTQQGAGNPSLTEIGTFAGFSAVFGSTSTPQVVTISGFNLTNDALVDCEAGMEKSTDNITYIASGTPITITKSGGSLPGQPKNIYLRITNTTVVAAGVTGHLTFTSTGATTLSVSYTYTVTSGNTLSTSPGSITLSSVAGSPGAFQTYTVTFSGTSILCTPPANVELSKDGGSTYNGSGGTQTLSSGSPVTMKARIPSTATAGTTITLPIVMSGTGVSPSNVGVTGSVSALLDTAKFAMSFTGYTVPAGFANVAGNPATTVCTATQNNITIQSLTPGSWPAYSDGHGAQDLYGMTGSIITQFPDNILMHWWLTYSSTGLHQADSATLGLSTPQYKFTGTNMTNAHHYTVYISGGINFSVAGFNTANNYYLKGAAVYPGVVYDNTNTAIGGATPNLFDGKNNVNKYIKFVHVIPDGSGNIFGYLFTVPGQEACLMSGTIIQQED